MMMMDSAMLNVNRMSRAIGGNGNTIIARTASTPIGTPTPTRIRSRIFGMTAGAEVWVVAMNQLPSVLRRITVESRIDGGPLRHDRAITPRVLHLVDVGEYLRDGDI